MTEFDDKLTLAFEPITNEPLTKRVVLNATRVIVEFKLKLPLIVACLTSHTTADEDSSEGKKEDPKRTGDVGKQRGRRCMPAPVDALEAARLRRIGAVHSPR